MVVGGSSHGLLLSGFGGRRAGFKAEAVIAGFDDVAVMGEPIQQGRGHLGIAENPSPFAEAQIGGDHHAGPLIELAEQVEQQGAPRGAERQVAKFVEDHDVQTAQPVGELSDLALRLLLLEGVDQLDGREEPHLLAMMLDRLNADRRGNMGLAGARTADEDQVVGVVSEVASVQLTDKSLVDLAGDKVESRF